MSDDLFVTRKGAQFIAEKIESYWHRRGHTEVVVRIIPVTAPDKREKGEPATLYVVRSNLVNGLPPSRLAEAA